MSDAGGVGLNLQRAANACINLELPWNPAVLEQRIGRIYRLDQEDPINVFHFVSEHGIESRIENVVGTKQALFSGLFDGTSDQIQFDSGASFLSSVEKLVQVDEMPAAPHALESADAADEELDTVERSSVEPGSGEAALADEVPGSAATATSVSPKPERTQASTAPAWGSSPAALFDALTINRTPDGGVRIEAPPGAAEQLEHLDPVGCSHDVHDSPGQEEEQDKTSGDPIEDGELFHSQQSR